MRKRRSSGSTDHRGTVPSNYVWQASLEELRRHCNQWSEPTWAVAGREAGGGGRWRAPEREEERKREDEIGEEMGEVQKERRGGGRKQVVERERKGEGERERGDCDKNRNRERL